MAFGAALGLSVVLASTASAATVTMGFDPDATLKGAVRYQEFRQRWRCRGSGSAHPMVKVVASRLKGT